MDRLKGAFSFVVIVAIVMAGLRVLHVATPLLFPGTRPGPIAIASLDDARRRAGFAPIVPGYHPASLGAEPANISLILNPTPTLIIVWRQDGTYLSLTEHRGNPRPETPPLAVPLEGVPDSLWWTAGPENHLVLSRLGFWIDLVTNLPKQDLKRFADTLTIY